MSTISPIASIKTVNYRIPWIDYAKGIRIFIVVLIHARLPSPLDVFLTSFGIPLFFFLSGLVFSFDHNPGYIPFLKKRSYQLLLPYFFFSIVTFLFWFFIGRNFGVDAAYEINPLIPLLGIVYGTHTESYLIHCSPLWFIPCMFVVQNMYYLLFKNRKPKIVIIGLLCFAVLGYLDNRYFPVPLPWGFNVALVSIVFYGVGNLLREIFIKDKSKTGHLLVIFIISLVVVSILSDLNSRVRMSNSIYGNSYFCFFVTSFIGIIMFVALTKILQHYFKSIKFLSFLGQNTLVILGLHLMSGSVVKAVTFYVFKLPLSIYDIAAVAVLYSIVSVVILVPVMLFMNKYLPFFVGKGYANYERK